jgi:hypothetical protein
MLEAGRCGVKVCSIVIVIHLYHHHYCHEGMGTLAHAEEAIRIAEQRQEQGLTLRSMPKKEWESDSERDT